MTEFIPIQIQWTSSGVSSGRIPFTSGKWEGLVDSCGHLSVLKNTESGHVVDFRTDEWKGPAINRQPWEKTLSEQLCFKTSIDHLDIELTYGTVKEAFGIKVLLKNISPYIWNTQPVSLRLGINCEMIRYPEWNDTLFPTLHRCEKTFFWGYFMSPKAQILTISSPNPIASWHYEFGDNILQIYTTTLDLVHALPLPERHPQNLTCIKPNEEREWILLFNDVKSVEEIKPSITSLQQTPMIDARHYTMPCNETIDVQIFSTLPVRAVCTAPDQSMHTLIIDSKNRLKLPLTFGPGHYKLTVSDENHQTAAVFYARKPWSEYLMRARKEALRIPQKATTHMESWLGHFSTTLAKRYFPDPILDQQAEANYQKIMPIMFDLEHGVPLLKPERIQNAYMMISLLLERYRTSNDPKELQRASKLGDWLITMQAHDGSYRMRVPGRDIHYTCVAYGAKCMLQLAIAEKNADMTESVRHFQSAERAMQDLLERLDNIETEGGMTYEDGMISCSAVQLAFYARHLDDSEKREAYLQAAFYMFNGHRCLDQMIIPDARMNGGTLRYWEARFDVLVPRNMMNSPHGWTAWRIPGLIDMYLLTGEESYLSRAFNSLGACVQLLDERTGELRWSFIPDPYVECPVLVNKTDDDGASFTAYENQIIGEQYLPMISGFYTVPDGKTAGGHWGDGGCCDNDVHEIFKALGEIAIDRAYILERRDGSFAGYNAAVETDQNGTLLIVPEDSCVRRVHLNIAEGRSCRILHPSGSLTESVVVKQIGWIEL